MAIKGESYRLEGLGRVEGKKKYIASVGSGTCYFSCYYDKISEK